MKFFTATLLLAAATIALAQDSNSTTPKGPPSLLPLFTAKVSASEGINIGVVPEGGNRTAFPITGGTFTGPRLNGTILPAGADFSLLTTDGLFSPNGISILQTDDGANILFRDEGFQLGDYVYGRVRFETGAKGYEWLNTAVCVSRALVSTGGASNAVGLEVWQVGE